MLDDALREWLVAALEDNLEIPLPDVVQEERYSGKFPLRLPKSLHRKLSEAALEDGVSLNQYLVMLLSENHTLNRVQKLLTGEQKVARPVSANARYGISEPSPTWLKDDGHTEKPAGKAKPR